MMSQPILELDDSLIAWCRGFRNATIHQEANELVHAAHVFCRQATMLTAATACAAMSRESSDDGFVDVINRDLRAVQPLGKVTGAVFVARRRQPRMPKAPQVPGELLYKRPQAARIHTPRASS